MCYLSLPTGAPEPRSLEHGAIPNLRSAGAEPRRTPTCANTVGRECRFSLQILGADSTLCSYPRYCRSLKNNVNITDDGRSRVSVFFTFAPGDPPARVLTR